MAHSSSSEKTSLTDMLIYGVDLKNRRIYFGVNLDTAEDSAATEFSITSVEYAVRALHQMSIDSDEPIEIHMCSYGGDPYAMLRLYDEIQACRCQVKFYGSGAVMSAATWIMVACDERYLHKNTTVMVHDGSEWWEGRHTDGQIIAGESKRLQNLLYEIFEQNTRMPKVFWQDVCQRDLYMTAEEAVKLGLADKVIQPRKRGLMRKMRSSLLKKHPSKKEMRLLISNLYKRMNKVHIPKIELNSLREEEEEELSCEERSLAGSADLTPGQTEG